MTGRKTKEGTPCPIVYLLAIGKCVNKYLNK